MDTKPFQTYLGVDQHSRYSCLTALDNQFNILKFQTIDNTREALASFLRGLPRPIIAAMEAGDNYRWFYDLLADLVDELILANAFMAKRMSCFGSKSDRSDSQNLARLLVKGLIIPVYVLSPETVEIQKLLRQRQALVQSRTKVKNRIRHMVRQNPARLVVSRQFTNLFCATGIAWLNSLAWEDVDRALLEVQLDQLQTGTRHIGSIEEQVRLRLKDRPEIELLTSIPGVGYITAATIYAEIEDINRFVNPKKLCAYAGLVPWIGSSAGKRLGGRQSRPGSKYLRTAAYLAALPAIRSNSYLRRIYEDKRHQRGPIIARTVVARKILQAVFYVWTFGKPFHQLPDQYRRQ